MSSDTIISKADADRIFGFRRSQWEDYATKVQVPAGWQRMLLPSQLGTVLVTRDQTTGLGLSVKPMFPDDDSLPDIIIVSSIYPQGCVPPFMEEFQKDLEEKAKNDLGDDYSVSATYRRVEGVEFVDLIISRATS